ncbi:MAG: hypothetical protein EXR72_21015 [Myxococcales bacterium]|nr:hypothetical protein [Myxococcales bacterium]
MLPALQAPRESLFRLASDLLRRSWIAVDANHYLDDYLASQWLPPTRLAALQCAALRRLVWHCVLHVPHHALAIGRALRPSEIERLDDVARLPLARASELQSDPSPDVAASQFQAEALAHQTAVRRRALTWDRGARWYSAPEVGVIAARCARGGLHVQADHLILESVDGDGRPVAPGSIGTLLVTDLHNYATPTLRHELPERGQIDRATCPCGRGLPLLARDPRVP